MSGFQLNDDQRAAATTLEGRMLITAGAGSGKTRVLTERIANAVISGAVPGWEPVDIEQVVAITFTDKAAGELAERIRGALRVAGYTEAARRVDASWISTIHGMCARMLRSEALRIGIDPDFRVLDAVESGQLRFSAMESTIRAASSDDDPAVQSLISWYAFDDLTTVIRDLAEFLVSNGLGSSDVHIEYGEDPQVLAREAVEFFSEIAVEIGSFCGELAAADDHAPACCGTVATLAEIESSSLAGSDLAVALHEAVSRHNGGRKSKGIRDQLDAVKSFRDSFGPRAIEAAVGRPARALVELAEGFARRYEHDKRSAGAMDFDDLELLTREMLRDPEVADRWRSRFRLVVVDEFQDTNATQLEIVKALGGENLCTVGDDRQSIYRFRGADIGVFRRHNADMRELGAAEHSLRTNYRSHADILNFVNRVFGAENMFGDDLIALECGREEPDPPVIPPGGVRVEALIAEAGRSTRAARSLVASEIARRLSGLHRDGCVALSDMVVLLRSYRHAEAYAGAIREQGLDVVILGGNRFADLRVIKAANAALRVLANRGDDAALFELLASDLCGVSDSTLLAIAEAGRDRQGVWSVLPECAVADEDRRRLDLVIAAVDEAVGHAARATLGESLLRFTERLGVDLRLLAEGVDGAQEYAALLKLARMADDFEMAGGAGAAAFVAYLEDKQRFGDHEPPASLVGDGAQAIRIMSIHASKGLEFPVVAIPELDGAGGRLAPFARWDLTDKPRLSLKLRGCKVVPDEFRAIEDRAKSAEAEETERLFYVACTRAREALILAGARSFDLSTGTGPSMLNMLMESLAITPIPDTVATLDVGGGTRVGVKMIGARADHDSTESRPCPDPARPRRAPIEPDWFEQVVGAPLVRPTAAEHPRRLSYSSVARYRACPLSFDAQRGSVFREADDTVPALRFGSAVHLALELVGEDGVLGEARLGSLTRSFGLDDDQVRRLRAAVERYQGSDVAATVRAHESVRREAALNVWIDSAGGGFVLGGSIDVYACSGDRALIVDYKSGSKSVTAEELAIRYRLQAGCYALAASRDGARVVETVFVRPEVEVGGQPQTASSVFTAADVAEVEAELRDVHERMAAGHFEPLDAWDGDLCGRCPVSAAICPTKRAAQLPSA